MSDHHQDHPAASVGAEPAQAIIPKRKAGRTKRKRAEPAEGSGSYAWGASGIGAAIGRNTRDTFYLLECGRVEGAIKVGNQWAAPKPVRLVADPKD